MSISVDKYLELHLKKPNFCFFKNYFDVGLQAWQANVDMQAVLTEYKAVTYMYQFFKKIQDQCSQAIKQALKEAFKNNMHYHDITKTNT